ncbi:hypothetical protein HPB51_002232 [Rhipicephalus microplus]|uniref:Tick transposon n=1 Tax=Rhipicephalus microplus TaxID=6941 RepID=A0A9J6EWE3_RHIMP|nr:hypothetical protein HPB51_002232 [Rhipicephalus microplus]
MFRDELFTPDTENLRQKTVPQLSTMSAIRILRCLTVRSQDLKLLQADKEGGFVLAPTTVYKEKADAAVTENFQVANVKPSKVKATASKLCEEAGLQKLASSVRAARGVNLSVFFSAKTHKPEVPFRVIVSEQGTWQRLVGRYLQRSLSVLPVEDPCLIRKPQIVSEFLQQECPSEVSFFSVDVKDLYYSLPMDQVCAEVISSGALYEWSGGWWYWWANKQTTWTITWQHMPGSACGVRQGSSSRSLIRRRREFTGDLVSAVSESGRQRGIRLVVNKRHQRKRASDLFMDKILNLSQKR